MLWRAAHGTALQKFASTQLPPKVVGVGRAERAKQGTSTHCKGQPDFCTALYVCGGAALECQGGAGDVHSSIASAMATLGVVIWYTNAYILIHAHA